MNITLTDKKGNFLKSGDFTEPEIRMAAKAGYRVFENDREITEGLTGLFANPTSSDRDDIP